MAAPAAGTGGFWTTQRQHYAGAAITATLGGVFLIGGLAMRKTQKGPDRYTVRLPGGGKIVRAEVDDESAKGVVTVQYVVDGVQYQVRDVVTGSLRRVSTKKKFMRDHVAGAQWDTVRYDPADKGAATLREEPNHTTADALVIVGSILIAIAAIHALYAAGVFARMLRFMPKVGAKATPDGGGGGQPQKAPP